MSMEATRKWLQENTRHRFSNPQQVYQQVDTALTQFRSLQPKIAEYIADDGVRQALLCLHGTLPVVFHGATFNIPVVFWFPRTFPEHSPLAYVTPTRAMVVKVGRHVDERGRVYHPYLASWATSSTLNDLFRSLIAVFSAEPPVFSRPPGHTGMAIKPPGVEVMQRPGMASASLASLPQASKMPVTTFPVGAMSMTSLPQSSSASLPMPGTKPSPSISLSSAFVRPMTAVESELATVSTPTVADARPQTSSGISASADEAGQALAQMRINPNEDTAEHLQPEPQPESKPEQQQQQQLPPSPPFKDGEVSLGKPESATYQFNPVSGRPPVPSLGPVVASPESANVVSPFADDYPELGHVKGQRPTGGGSKPPDITESTSKQRASDPEQTNGASKLQQHTASVGLLPPDSASTIAHSVAETAAAVLASTPTTAVEAAPTEPKSPVASPEPSSLLDAEPMDDPQKRLVGYQLAIFDRVTSAVKRSREKHTRVNKELLDQSANLNSGAGVIAEERRQLLESQRQLSANISVLENKLNELNEKKAEFPDAAEISDVRTVFHGQSVASEQLFDLAGEIAAIDDTLYLLGRALDDGKLALGTYMRQVRKLAQQQFLAKALAIKIRRLCALDK
ncbi:UEV-domain-containing protein [Coemansia reversa NRRL 1564]|uniref:UEV-domain-containing protein n=1 Tax=Coemansia reversa (strain ATCC 12441 / NRRL 1564) TaxID=763665 RepID=A0A2G5B7D1_COERN|nr:UEV-domain-containing protein [Coemansia reversa NRRL 1564]|eukprot:PIA14936.1 UEV-domain-containing protein [Coemansia reversa NRRL 1564]